MNKEEVERIALEVVDSITAPFISDERMTRFAHRFLARIDAERGKDAIGYDALFNAIADATDADAGAVTISVRMFEASMGGKLFLSPTIPLTDEQIDIGIREAEKKGGDCDPTDFERGVKFCEKVHGIATQGERK